MGRQRDRNRMAAVMAGARERGMVPNAEPLTDEHLDMLEQDFRAGRGCFSGDGLALVAEVRALRAKVELLEIEVKGWERLVYDNCGCLGSGYPKLPEDFNERWAAVAGEEKG